MKIIRAISFGSLVWAFVLTTFIVLSFIPGIKDSETQQGFVLGILIIPFASLGAALYYRKGDKSNGFKVGIVMVSIALLLDAIITLPLIEIPHNGSSYSSFFSNPLLWILVVLNLTVVYFYWRLKVKPSA